MAERFSDSTILGETFAAIEKAPFRGAAAAALMTVELLRANNERAVACVYELGFDAAVRLLLESDVARWRVEAVDAICDLVRFCEKAGSPGIVAELAAKDWLVEAIREVGEGDAPTCLENGCRFLAERFAANGAD
jgi:hypothetical protein